MVKKINKGQIIIAIICPLIYNFNIKKWQNCEKIKYAFEVLGLRRKCFVSKATGKIEDEYLTGLLKEEFIEYNREILRYK